MSENLAITYLFKETPEKLFEYFVEPKYLVKWFREDTYWTTEAHVDFKVGGRYDITMVTEIGNTFTHDGTFKEIEPPSKLKFTWGSGIVENTEVTLFFNAIDNQHTEVQIIHNNFPTFELRERHILLWENCLHQLEKWIKNPEPYAIYQDPEYYAELKGRTFLSKY